MPKMLTKLRIREVSSVDRGAGEGVKIMLMKREDDDSAEPYWKREFSASDRKRDAKSGAAESDGSFPIHNSGDLHNAMRAIGRSKNPSKTRAHIRARARALGLTSELSDSFKRDEPMSKISSFFGNLFKGSASNSVLIDKSVEGLAESVTSILADEDSDDVAKGDAMTKTFEQFAEHLKTNLTAVAVDKKESDMDIKVLAKALGLADNATEAEVTSAIAKSVATSTALAVTVTKLQKDLEIEKADYTDAEEAYLRKESLYDAEEDEKPELSDDEKKRRSRKKAFRLANHTERANIMKSAEPPLPAHIQKVMDEIAVLKEQNAKLMQSVGLEGFKKQATENGLPETEAETLQKAYSGDKTAIDKLLGFAKSAIAAARVGGVFKEFGSSQGGITDDPYDALVAKAEELRKHDPKLTPAAAFAKVYEDPSNIELVRKERDKNRPQAA